jgi:hypothetical protein
MACSPELTNDVHFTTRMGLNSLFICNWLLGKLTRFLNLFLVDFLVRILFGAAVLHLFQRDGFLRDPGNPSPGENLQFLNQNCSSLFYVFQLFSTDFSCISTSRTLISSSLASLMGSDSLIWSRWRSASAFLWICFSSVVSWAIRSHCRTALELLLASAFSGVFSESRIW